MKHKKYLPILLMLVALLLPVEATVITVDPNRVQAVYDYSEFSIAGAATKIYDPVHQKYTFVYKNATVTGYYGTDGKFITEQVVEKYASGVTKKVSDLINQRYMEYNEAGALVKAYNVLDGQVYNAQITYTADGGYTISWKGKIDKDGDPNTTNDQEIINDAVVQKYDPAGRLLEVVNKGWDKDKQSYVKSTSKYVYDAAGNILRVETYADNGEKLAVTYFDSLGRETYTTSYDPEGKYWYTSSRNFYDGLKLVKTENYEQTGSGTQKLMSTVYYDKHGRMSHVIDNMGREIQRYFYNDTSKPVTQTVQYGGNSVVVTANPGQIIKVENYSYGDNGIKTTMITYFHQNKQRITIMGESTIWDVDKYNAWLKSVAPDIPVGVDPTIRGQLKVKDMGNGEVYIVFGVTDKAEVEKMIAEVKRAKDQWGRGLDSFFDQLLVALGDTNKDGRLSDDEWNAKGRKVELYVGAIDPSRMQQAGNQAAAGTSGNYGQTGGGHQRKDIDSTAV
ncbi:MAG: hypothetical protein N2555_03465, partial [Endomicrobia bacterium]|nr:hypothetical protein [Endomicrobiia bacterium]